MTSLIVDASVAVRWYLPESGSDPAERILAGAASLLAPELVLAEIGNAVWKRVRKSEVSIETALAIVDRAKTAFTKLTSMSELAAPAMGLSARYDHPIYDCFYLALAERESAPLVTADKRLAALAGRVGVAVATFA